MPESKFPILLGGIKSSDRPKNIINNDILEYIPRDMHNIPSLRHIGLSKRNNKNIIIILLSKDASINEINIALNLLDQIENNIKKDLISK